MSKPVQALGQVNELMLGMTQRKRASVWAEGIPQDVRYAVRNLGRSPGFTATAIVTLAVAIGINAGVFTIARTVLFGGYPNVDPNDRILYTPVGPIPNAEFDDWKAQAKSFTGIAGVADGGLRLVFQDDSGTSETTDTTQLSANAFQVLGVKPVMGRDFAPSDAIPGAPSVALLSYAFWERRFGHDPSVIGKSFRLNDRPVTVIGVMPPGFTFPTPRVDLWTQVIPQAGRPSFFWFVFGRLADGATRQSAQAEMDTIARRLEVAYPRAAQGPQFRFRTFGEQFLGASTLALYRAIWWAVGLVLMIGCANLANLLLARGIGRHREISLRMALGAGRWRIVRQFLIESLMLSGAAAVLGWFVAWAGVQAYQRVASPPGFYTQYGYSLDYRVLLYLAGISILAGLLFGLAPAFRLAKLDVNSALKDGGRGATVGRSGKRLSAALVAVEIAFTIVPMAGAGLMVRSFVKVYTEDIGALNAPNILVASVGLPDGRYPGIPARTAYFNRLLTELRQTPGVDSVALSDSIPGIQDSTVLPYELEGLTATEVRRLPTSIALTITPDYFRTVGASVVSGRDLNQLDRSGAPAIALVSEQFARAHWPGVNPLGQRLRLYRGPNAGEWRTVAGVVSNIVQVDWAGHESDQVVYVPYLQEPAATMNILVQTHVRDGSFAAALRRQMQAMDPALDIGAGMGAGALEGPVRLTERVRASRYWTRAVNAGLLLTFAAIALLLAAIGLYAVIAHRVSSATQEIGVRMAIGARPGDIRGLVLRQGMAPVIAGLAAGLAASAGFSRLLQAQLFSVSSTDPATFAIAGIVLLAVAMLACFVPARRAMSVDPVVALRHE